MDFSMFIKDGSLSGISDIMDDCENKNQKKSQKTFMIAEKSIRSSKN